MARWKINADCVLPIDGVVFEQRLTTNTGRPCTERWPAHQLIEIADPSFYNAEDEQGNRFIVVGTKPYKRDLVIDPAALKKGWVPNPDMEPLDAEAQAITDRIPRNVYPMSETALPSTMGAPQPSSSELAELRSMLLGLSAEVKALTERNEALESLVAESSLDDVVESPEAETVQ